MTTNDMIYLIKELAICQYVLVIHSPHLCSLPGFKAEKVDVEPAAIKCRQVLADEDFEAWANGDEQMGVYAPRFEVQRRTVDPAGGVEESSEEDGAIKAANGPSLRELLVTALEKMQNRLTNGEAGLESGEENSLVGAEEGEEVVFISWDEGEDGTVLLDGDILAAGEGMRERLREADRQMILKVVRDYLESKGDEEEEKRQRDEL
jgi:protein OS-9